MTDTRLLGCLPVIAIPVIGVACGLLGLGVVWPILPGAALAFAGGAIGTNMEENSQGERPWVLVAPIFGAVVAALGWAFGSGAIFE